MVQLGASLSCVGDIAPYVPVHARCPVPVRSPHLRTIHLLDTPHLLHKGRGGSEHPFLSITEKGVFSDRYASSPKMEQFIYWGDKQKKVTAGGGLNMSN